LKKDQEKLKKINKRSRKSKKKLVRPLSANQELSGVHCLECEADEVLLVQATGHDTWFLDTLDALGISWEAIPGVPRWIQFEIPSLKLQWLVQEYPDVVIGVLA